MLEKSRLHKKISGKRIEPNAATLLGTPAWEQASITAKKCFAFEIRFIEIFEIQICVHNPTPLCQVSSKCTPEPACMYSFDWNSYKKIYQLVKTNICYMIYSEFFFM